MIFFVSIQFKINPFEKFGRARRSETTSDLRKRSVVETVLLVAISISSGTMAGMWVPFVWIESLNDACDFRGLEGSVSLCRQGGFARMSATYPKLEHRSP